MNRSSHDPVLTHARATASRLLVLSKQSWPKLASALNKFDPVLPGTVAKVASTLAARGMPPNAALHEAVARSFADSSIRKIQSIGRAAQRGHRVSWSSGMGLGGLGDATADAVAKAFQGILCSTQMTNSISDIVGRTQGADAHSATTAGIAATQGAAQCSQLNQPATPAPTPTPDATPTPAASPLVTYGVSFAVLAGVVAVGYFAIKKRPKAATV
jgi:hypothetical protein